MTMDEEARALEKEYREEIRQDINKVAYLLYCYVSNLQYEEAEDDADKDFGSAFEVLNYYRREGMIPMAALADFLYFIQRMEHTSECSLRSIYDDVCSLFGVDEREEDVEYIHNVLDCE